MPNCNNRVPFFAYFFSYWLPLQLAAETGNEKRDQRNKSATRLMWHFKTTLDYQSPCQLSLLVRCRIKLFGISTTSKDFLYAMVIAPSLSGQFFTLLG